MRLQDRQYGSDKVENYLFRCASWIQACVDIYTSNNNVPRMKWSIKNATVTMWNVSGLCRYNRFVLRSSRSHLLRCGLISQLSNSQMQNKFKNNIINNISILYANNNLK